MGKRKVWIKGDADTTFNIILAETRISRDMTVADAARATGLSPSFINAYESCSINPTAKTMLAFSMAYGLKFEISRMGITIMDTETDTVLLNGFKFEMENKP
jgi:transcriptional regulator with XRE-family HTH domain